MEIRQLRYVITLSETLHFGRAAAREYITQSTFSQQVARLERQLGTPLFNRSSNRVSLTPAGEMFIPRARRILAELEAAGDEARNVGSGSSGTLRVGIFGDGAAEMTSLIISGYRKVFPQVDIHFTELSMRNQAVLLGDEAVDVALLRPPIPDDRFELHKLYAEPRYAAVPSTHRLADATELSIADIIDEPFAVASAPTPRAWSTFWSCDEQRDAPARTGAEVGSIAESVCAIAYLGAVDTFPAAEARFHPHPGVTYVPLVDGGHTAVAVAHRRGDKRPIVEGFRDLALRVARDHVDLVPEAVAEMPVLSTS